MDAAWRRRERAFADLAAELTREAARHALLRASELAWELEDAVAAAEAFDDDLLGAAAHESRTDGGAEQDAGRREKAGKFVQVFL